MDVGPLQGSPISYPDDNSNSSQLAANTHYQRKICTITQDYLFHLMDTMFFSQQQLFTSKQASSQKNPLKFLCDFAHSILGKETGNFLERHLLMHPKYKDVWSQSFRKDIRWKTTAFLTKQQIPPMQRHHIRTNHLRVPFQKGRPLPYPHHDGWELNQLPQWTYSLSNLCSTVSSQLPM